MKKSLQLVRGILRAVCGWLALCLFVAGWAVAQTNVGAGKTVVVDAWFNSQQRKAADGRMEYFHYKWEDTTNSGFSLLAQIFHDYGATTDTLYAAPTVENLKKAQVYIIASPDIPAKNPHPNYMQPRDAEEMAKWVKQGGVLVMMENDPANAEIDRFNLLATKFGIRFNSVLSHHVVGTDIENGRIVVSAGGPIFQKPHVLYMKDTCTISVTKPAVAALVDDGDVVMATAKYGRGTVFAVVDPWLYNEYTNRKNLPAEYDNYAAGEDWARWVLEQVPAKRGGK